MQTILGIDKLGADVNKLDGWSTTGSIARARGFCTLPDAIGMVKRRVDSFERFLGPSMSEGIFACPV